MSRRARILFYCKLPWIGIYSIRLTHWIMSKQFWIWFRHVRNNLFAGTGNTLHYMPDSAYRHSVELHRMVRNGYSVSIRWVVKTVQCSLPMCVVVVLCGPASVISGPGWSESGPVPVFFQSWDRTSKHYVEVWWNMFFMIHNDEMLHVLGL